MRGHSALDCLNIYSSHTYIFLSTYKRILKVCAFLHSVVNRQTRAILETPSMMKVSVLFVVAAVAFTLVVVPFCNCRAKPIVSQRYRNELRKHIRSSVEFEEGQLYTDGLSSGDNSEEIKPALCVLNLTKKIYELEILGGECLDVVEFDDCCQPKFLQLTTSGVYPLQHQRMVYCDMESDGGGWLVIQRRTQVIGDRKQRSFNKTWNQYRRGFGPVDKNSFWLGLDTIHQLTSVPGGTELMVELEHFNGTKEIVYYDTFHVEDENKLFRVTISGYDSERSTIVDSMSIMNGAAFSTKDRDNEKVRQFGQELNCAARHGGGWWYKANVGCATAVLNQHYYETTTERNIQGIPWVVKYYQDVHVGSEVAFFASSEMKIRPKTWRCGKYLNYDPETIQHRFILRNWPTNLTDEDDDENEGNEEQVTTTTTVTPTMETTEKPSVQTERPTPGHFFEGGPPKPWNYKGPNRKRRSSPAKEDHGPVSTF